MNSKLSRLERKNMVSTIAVLFRPRFPESISVAGTAARTNKPVVAIGPVLPSGWSNLEGRYLVDPSPVATPMSGVATALMNSPGSVLAVGSNLSALKVSHFQWLIEEAYRSSGPHGVVVRHGRHLEPLFSIYTQACLSAIQRLVALKSNSLDVLLEIGRFARVQAPPEIAVALSKANASAKCQKVQE